jgi:hypothetical protein
VVPEWAFNIDVLSFKCGRAAKNRTIPAMRFDARKGGESAELIDSIAF